MLVVCYDQHVGVVPQCCAIVLHKELFPVAHFEELLILLFPCTWFLDPNDLFVVVTIPIFALYVKFYLWVNFVYGLAGSLLGVLRATGPSPQTTTHDRIKILVHI